MSKSIKWFLIIWTYILLVIVGMTLDALVAYWTGINTWWMSAMVVLPYWMGLGFPFGERVWKELSGKHEQ